MRQQQQQKADTSTYMHPYHHQRSTPALAHLRGEKENQKGKTRGTSSLSTSLSLYEMYRSVLRRLLYENVTNPVKMGLENSLALYRLMDSPLNEKTRSSLASIVHVAGTNGKVSD